VAPCRPVVVFGPACCASLEVESSVPGLWEPGESQQCFRLKSSGSRGCAPPVFPRARVTIHSSVRVKPLLFRSQGTRLRPDSPRSSLRWYSIRTGRVGRERIPIGRAQQGGGHSRTARGELAGAAADRQRLRDLFRREDRRRRVWPAGTSIAHTSSAGLNTQPTLSPSRPGIPHRTRVAASGRRLRRPLAGHPAARR
jgi:hypothetical protein